MNPDNVRKILGKVFNCGASQCMSIYSKKDTLTPEKAIAKLRTLILKMVGEDKELPFRECNTLKEAVELQSEINCISSYNQAKQEIRQRIKEMFK